MAYKALIGQILIGLVLFSAIAETGCKLPKVYPYKYVEFSILVDCYTNIYDSRDEKCEKFGVFKPYCMKRVVGGRVVAKGCVSWANVQLANIGCGKRCVRGYYT